MSESDESMERHKSLRRRLATVLIAVTFGSVMLLGLVNYYQARVLLTDEVGKALAARGDAIARQIDSALTAIQDTAAVVAGGPLLADDLDAFASAFEELNADGVATEEQRAALEDHYRAEVIAPLEAAGLPSPDEEALLPTSDAGVILQYRYLVGPGDDAPDGSASGYAEVYEQRHERLEVLAQSLGFSGLILIDRTGTVVFATDLRPDLGSSLTSGPYAETGLASVVTERLETAPTGDAIFSDFEFYLPASGRPTMFAVVALRNGGTFEGAVAFEIPVEALNQLTTFDGMWEEVGLGDTGELYIVGPDGLMRSESRRWLDSPAEYVEALRVGGFDAELISRIEALGTTVRTQPVASDVVTDALDGITNLGRTTDYLGRRSLAYAAPIPTEGLGWVVVAEVSDAEAGASLASFRSRLLILAAVLLPIAGLLGLAIADRITKPIGPVVDTARSIARGDLDTAVPTLGSNEFGDVARRLEDMAAYLRSQEEALEAEDREITRMLLAALPPRLVEQLKAGDRAIEDLVDTATIISVTVTGIFDDPSVDPGVAVEVGGRISRGFEQAAERFGIERVRSSSIQHLFVAGLGVDDAREDDAVSFAVEARHVVRTEGAADDVTVGFHAGLASGRVVSGLLSGTQLAFGVFGDAVELALTLDAAAGAEGAILLHESVVAALDSHWELAPADDLIDLSTAELVAMQVPDRPAVTDHQGEV